MGKKLSIIMPTHNEAHIIRRAIQEVRSTFRSIPWNYEIIVSDDGSINGTTDLIPPSVKVVRTAINCGKGRAIQRAWESCEGEYVVWIDSDLDIHPDYIFQFIKKMVDTKADVIIGSKLHKRSYVEYPLVRRVLCWGYYLITKVLFNLPCKDTQTGLKLFKREVLEVVMPKVMVKRFAFDLEVLVVANYYQYKIVEHPVIVVNRRNRVKLSTVWTTLRDTLAVWYRLRILKFYY